jgi:hypothetical protein
MIKPETLYDSGPHSIYLEFLRHLGHNVVPMIFGKKAKRVELVCQDCRDPENPDKNFRVLIVRKG